MNDLEQLQQKVAERFPDHELRTTRPLSETGAWFLDLFRGDSLPPVVVEWRPGLGFGITTPRDDEYGAGADEIHPDASSAFRRVVRLVLSNGLTGGQSLDHRMHDVGSRTTQGPSPGVGER